MNIVKNGTRYLGTHFLTTSNHYRKALIGVLAISCLIGGGTILYRWYDEQIQKTAYAALRKAMKAYNTPVIGRGNNKNVASFTSEQEKWVAVENAFKDAYDNNSSAGIAPFFLIYRGEAALNANDHNAAFNFFTQAIQKMSSGPLKDLWQVKTALVGIDSKNQQLAAQGIDLLKKFSENQHNTAQQYAQYELGLYYWNQGDFNQAKSVWQQLVVQHASGDDSESDFFVSKVKSRLSLITPEN